MRYVCLLMLGVAAAGCASAQAVTKFTAEREAAIYNGPRVGVAMWIWSDKYTYQPGQSLTLRWTVKTNNDLYPYTVFVYSQNNQTGAKTYYPNGTATVTDSLGSTAAQGFQPQRLSNVTKAVLLGTGGIAPAVTIPNEPGMHTLVVELRDYTGTTPLKTAYMKIGVYTKTETIAGGEITTSKTLTNDTLYTLTGIAFVKSGAVLTIEPGTFILGREGTSPNISAIVITRTATIEARGTEARPIIFTSEKAFGARARGNWGGVILLGKAPVNLAAGASNNNPAGEGYIEGLQTTADGLYGGTDPTHYCGTLTYARFEYAGAILSPNNEINSITFGGCGNKTVAHHLQSHYGLDDAFEWFGGTMNAKYLFGGLGADDCVDFQLGYVGKIQHVVCYQSPDAPGARGLEGDNNEFVNSAEPWSNPTMYNLTFVGLAGAGTEDNPTVGVLLRRGARASINNVVTNQWRGGSVFLADPSTQTQGVAGNISMNGILMWKGNLAGAAPTPPADTLAGNIPNAATLTFLQGQQNIVVADPLLTRPFEFSDPDFAGLFSSPIFRVGWVQPPDDGFFDQNARYVGGIGASNWAEGWTNTLVEQDIAP